jgi:hypothetical protein
MSPCVANETKTLSEPIQEFHPMKSTHPLAALSLAAILLGTGTRAIAGDGHDHGDAAPAATVRRGGKNRVVLDRICAVTRIFEAWSDETWDQSRRRSSRVPGCVRQ